MWQTHTLQLSETWWGWEERKQAFLQCTAFALLLLTPSLLHSFVNFHICFLMTQLMKNLPSLTFIFFNFVSVRVLAKEWLWLAHHQRRNNSLQQIGHHHFNRIQYQVMHILAVYWKSSSPLSSTTVNDDEEFAAVLFVSSHLCVCVKLQAAS